MPGTNIAVTTDAYNKASDKSWLGTRMGLQDMRSITLDISTFDDEHVVNGYIPSGIALGKISATGKYGPYDPGTQVNEVGVITVNATAGNWKATFEGDDATVAFNVSAANLKAALEALPGIGAGDVSVSGGPGDAGGTTPYTVTFTGALADRNVTDLTVADVTLTGGGDSVGVVLTQGGGSGAATDGTQTFAGLLFEEVKVNNKATDADCGAALYWRGVVKESRLPSFSGTGAGIGVVDSAAKVAVPSIRFE